MSSSGKRTNWLTVRFDAPGATNKTVNSKLVVPAADRLQHPTDNEWLTACANEAIVKPGKYIWDFNVEKCKNNRQLMFGVRIGACDAAPAAGKHLGQDDATVRGVALQLNNTTQFGGTRNGFKHPSPGADTSKYVRCILDLIETAGASTLTMVVKSGEGIEMNLGPAFVPGVNNPVRPALSLLEKGQDVEVSDNDVMELLETLQVTGRLLERALGSSRALPVYHPTIALKNHDDFTRAMKQALVNPGTGKPCVASIYIMGPPSAGKSQCFNVWAALCKGAHLAAPIRAVSAAADSQCSLLPFRWPIAKGFGATKWNAKDDGNMWLNDNRGFDDMFFEEAAKASFEGRLRPSQAFPVGTAQDEERVQIRNTAPGSANFFATAICYFVTAKSLLNSPTSYFDKAGVIRRAAQQCKHPNAANGSTTELAIFFVITQVDELPDVEKKDLLLPVAESKNEALQALAKAAKEKLGLTENSYTLLGFLQNMNTYKLDEYSDSDGALVAARSLLLRLAEASAAWLDNNDIVQLPQQGNPE